MSTSILKFQHNIGRASLPPTVRHIGLVVATFADKVSGKNAYPSIRTIQARSGRSRPTVIKAIRRLKNDGWIDIDERQGNGQGWRHRRYSLATPAHAKRGKPTLPRPAARSFYIKNNHFLNQKDGDKSPEKTAASLWLDVIKAISRTGRYRTPDLDPKAMEAIKKIGGWGSLCGSMEFDLRPGGPIYKRFKSALSV